ncbi:glycosyltransferase [Microbacterium sp. ARD31]|uniref:CgeB family protein n=1 Tax=Microbacterium sp. ARD31 TaxID=2962576 RepID=UPI002881217B|nr:glycosyltransferase [Microbacterium sp. ARD31]MDT0183419.1 glycosyltransferase [Microbacterium sp. ARD31]
MRVLLVSPGFHGYHLAISAALAARDHDVATHVYDHHGSLSAKGWHHLRHQLPHKIGAGSLRGLARQETARAVAAVEDVGPEAVVVVKGDSLGPSFWESISGIPRVTWLYDELRRTRWDVERLAAIGPVATYSPDDCATFIESGLAATYLPLAYDHRLVGSPAADRATQISFVGARYPAREAVLTTLHDHDLPVRAYGRDWSGHPYDRLRTWRLTTPGLPAERDVTRAEAYDVMASSAGTLNLHGDQDGFTMRTFEASGVGGVQLIDRADVSGLYEPGTEVLTWTHPEELVDLCRRALSDPAWTDAIREAARARTLAEHTFDHRAAALEDSWDTA